MQVDENRDLETRLEQALSRWRHDKDIQAKETARCAKLSLTCSGLIEKNEKLDAEVRRYDARLRQYDELPMPDEIKLRMKDMQADVHRAATELNTLTEAKELAEQEALRLSDLVKETNEALDTHAQQLVMQGTTIEELRKEVYDVTNKIQAQTGELHTKEDLYVGLQIEFNHAVEMEKQATEVTRVHTIHTIYTIDPYLTRSSRKHRVLEYTLSK